MYEPNQEEGAIDSIAKKIRICVGLCLLIAGILISIWLLQNVYNLLLNESDFFIIAKLSPKNADGRAIISPWGKFILPASYFYVLGYGVIFLLFTVIAGVANNFMRVGGNLLQPEIKKVMEKIRDEFVKSMKNLNSSERDK